MKPIYLFLAATLLGSAARASAPKHEEGFLPFWSRFRAAALHGDMTVLRGLAKLPLQVGFDSDQDDTMSIGVSQFPTYMRTELHCRAADGGTNLDMIRAKPRADGRFDFHDARRATVGLFSFTNGATGWRLTLMNYGTPTDFHARLRGHC